MKSIKNWKCSLDTIEQCTIDTRSTILYPRAYCDSLVLEAIDVITSDSKVTCSLYPELSSSCSNSKDRIHMPRVDNCVRRDHFDYIAIRRADAEVVGQVSIFQQTLSYCVAPKWWGFGYGTELVSGICQAAPKMLSVFSLYAETLRENYASRRILEANGFRFLGLCFVSHSKYPVNSSVLRYRWLSNF